MNKRHRETRAAIATAAVSLFTERGFDVVTMDDVGRAAGVSRRTVYRHFPSKDELVFEHPRSWVRYFDDEVEAGDTSVSSRETLERCLLSVAALVDATAADVLTAYNVYLLNPGLRGSHASIDEEWFGRFAEILGSDMPQGAHRDDDIAAVAGALVGTINGLLLSWASQWPTKSMLALAQRSIPRVLDLVPGP